MLPATVDAVTRGAKQFFLEIDPPRAQLMAPSFRARDFRRGAYHLQKIKIELSVGNNGLLERFISGPATERYRLRSLNF